MRTSVCKCGKGDLKDDPLHFQACLYTKTATTQRHNLVQNTLAEIANECNVIYKIKEKSEVDEKIPDIKFEFLRVHRVTGVRSTISDVSIIHPSSTTYLNNGSSALGAATRRENEKIIKYTNETNAHTEFIPFVLESYGAFGKQSLAILKLMMDYKTRSLINSYHYKIEEILENEYLFDAKVRLSIVLQRGNHIVNTQGLRMINSTFDTRQQVHQHSLHG